MSLLPTNGPGERAAMLLKRAWARAVPLTVRYGREFRNYYRLLSESQWWDRERLIDYQGQMLKLLVHHAWENVPYYRDLFQKIGLRPEDVRGFEDLVHIPVLTRETLQERWAELVARNFPSQRSYLAATSGSTGTPVHFLRDRLIDSARWMAVYWRQWHWGGHRSGDKMVDMSGGVFRKGIRASWDYNPLTNILALSSDQIDEGNLYLFVKLLRRFGARAVRGYPSSLAQLAGFVREKKIGDISFDRLLTSSEMLLPGQRQFLEESFRGKVYDLYGHSERAVAAGQCEVADGYHIFIEYGVLEVVGEDGHPVKDGEAGEILATGFTNQVMPLIRYRTSDVAAAWHGACPCNRGLPLLKHIEGRLQEMLVTADGRLISIASLNMHNDCFLHVRAFQFRQERPGEASLLLVKRPSFKTEDGDRILAEIHKKTGDQVRITPHFVDRIEATSHGKVRFLVQELPVEGYLPRRAEVLSGDAS